MMRNSPDGFGVLTDLTLTPIEALRQFSRLSRRWTPISQGFVLGMSGGIRAMKLDRTFEEGALTRWADDGGQ